MPEILVRASVFVLVSILLWLVIWAGRRFVEGQRRRVLATEPPVPSVDAGEEYLRAGTAPVRILAFSSADCHQCHQLQMPALQRVLQARSNDVSVLEIDAPSSPELAQRYRVLTLPTTVVLDDAGRARAVNYGFANTGRLLEQVDEVLAASPPTPAPSSMERG